MGCPTQVVHLNFTTSSVLLSDDGTFAASGKDDFSRIAFATLVADIAASLADLGCAHAAGGPAELFRMGRIFLDGYQSVTPLEARGRGVITPPQSAAHTM